MDVYYSLSLDHTGTSWSEPIRVNPEEGRAAFRTPRSLSMAADEEGHAYVSYGYAPFLTTESVHIMTTRRRPYDGLDHLPFFTVAASPTPFREATTFGLPVPDAARGDVHVFDAQGRVVRVWRDLQLVRGPNEIIWDGRASNGLDAAAGVYLWRATVTDERLGGVHEARGRVVRVGR
jgi:hypothetical protein